MPAIRCDPKPATWGPMREFFARENIRRFEAQLAACTDSKQRKILAQLLDAEREQLADAQASKQADGARE